MPATTLRHAGRWQLGDLETLVDRPQAQRRAGANRRDAEMESQAKWLINGELEATCECEGLSGQGEGGMEGFKWWQEWSDRPTGLN